MVTKKNTEQQACMNYLKGRFLPEHLTKKFMLEQRTKLKEQSEKMNQKVAELWSYPPYMFKGYAQDRDNADSLIKVIDCALPLFDKPSKKM